MCEDANAFAEASDLEETHVCVHGSVCRPSRSGEKVYIRVYAKTFAEPSDVLGEHTCV